MSMMDYFTTAVAFLSYLSVMHLDYFVKSLFHFML